MTGSPKINPPMKRPLTGNRQANHKNIKTKDSLTAVTSYACRLTFLFIGAIIDAPSPECQELTSETTIELLMTAIRNSLRTNGKKIAIYILYKNQFLWDNEWKDVQKKDTNKRPSETRNRRKTRKKIINKTSYFLSNSLNKSLNQKWKVKISPMWRRSKTQELFYEKWIPFQQ